ncbi:hypothetical protein [Acidithiobacillus sp. AMEEHan]|uniref:hypothetical protein n=1 Tax=Acidithiobacillus sp. AMEEHan TaxID=2994951 RepID=UPI0027E521FE|nr:hypothetical protein [Acidithiobacillus sp. AMEEHan]
MLMKRNLTLSITCALALLTLAPPSYAQESSLKFHPTPAAPKSALQVKSMGVGDPYPRANDLAIKNGTVVLNGLSSGDYSGSRAWNGEVSSSFLWGGVESQRFDHITQQFATKGLCEPLDRPPPPHGITFSNDLKDFVVSLPALQAALGAKGILFAPSGTEQWMALKASTVLSPKPGVRTQMQTFTRAVFFLTTGDPRVVRDEIVRAAEALGYEDIPPPKVPGFSGADDFAILKQPVVGAVFNSALVTTGDDKAGKSFGRPARRMDISCLVTDKVSKNYLLHTVKPGTNHTYQIKDLRFGYIAQFSPIPLGKDTEPFTKAHVNARLEKERTMSPQQVAARRNAEEERLFREAYQNSPGAQKHDQKLHSTAENGKKEIQSYLQEIGPNGENLAKVLISGGMSPDKAYKLAAQTASSTRDTARIMGDIAQHFGQRHQELMQ